MSRAAKWRVTAERVPYSSSAWPLYGVLPRSRESVTYKGTKACPGLGEGSLPTGPLGRGIRTLRFLEKF